MERKECGNTTVEVEGFLSAAGPMVGKMKTTHDNDSALCPDL